MKNQIATLLFTLIVKLNLFAQIQYTKSLYVENFPQLILGDTQREDNLLSFAQSRGYTSLILYNIQEIFPIRYEQTSHLGTPETDLVAFIAKAKTQYGISEIGVTSGANWDTEDGALPQTKIVETTTFGFETAPTSGITNFPQIENSISSVTIPFSFTDLDQNVTNQIFVSSNGYIALGLSASNACASCSTATYIPDPSSTSPKNIIAGLWDSFTFIPSSEFRYFTIGSTPNLIAVFDWRNVQFKTGTIIDLANFQIKLFEDQHFEIHIQNGSENPSTASRQTIGIQNSTGTEQVSPPTGNLYETYRHLHYPATGDKAWSFKPKEMFDYIDINVRNYNSRTSTPSNARIDLVSLEFEWWNTYSPYRWESVKHWQHQLDRTYNMNQASPHPFKIMPYVNKFSNYPLYSDFTNKIDVQAFYQFIDDRSDIVALTYYFSDVYIKETNLPSNFGNVDGYSGYRLEGFASNTKKTKIRLLLNAEPWFFGGTYLYKLEGHRWTENGLPHSYDEDYFANKLPEDKILEEFEIALTQTNPYRSSSNFPCGNAGNSLSCTMDAPWGSNSVGNILEGALWFRYSYMPGANFLMYGPNNRNVGYPSYYTIESSNILSTFPSNLTTSEDFGKNLWYKWSKNQDGHNQFLDISLKLNCDLTLGSSTVTTLSTIGLTVGMHLYNDPNLNFPNGTTVTSILNSTTFTISSPANNSTSNYLIRFTTPTIYVKAPRLFKKDSYLHQVGLSSITNYHSRLARNQMDLTTVAITEPYPRPHYIRVDNIIPGNCPNFNTGSARVALEPTDSLTEITQATITWWKNGGVTKSTGAPVNLPYTIDSLEVGTWLVSVDYLLDSVNLNISDTLIIDRVSDFKPEILNNRSGINCDANLHTDLYQTYQWKLNNTLVSTSPTYEATSNGKYTLEVIDTKGCSGKSDPFIVKLKPEPSFEIESSNSLKTEISVQNYNQNDDYHWLLPADADVQQDDNLFSITWNNQYNVGLPISCRITNECGLSVIVPIVPECTDEFTYHNLDNNDSITTGNTITRQNMCFNGQLNIVEDFTFKDCGTVSFAPGAKILIKNGVSLTIDNCTFGPSSCCRMWKGIEMENGSRIIVKNGSTICEAEYGIIVKDGCVYKIMDSHFRNNYIGMLVGNTSSSTTNGTGSKIINTDFYSDPYTCSGTTYYNFAPRYEGQLTNPSTLPLAGIKLDNVTFMKFGSSTPALGGDVRFRDLNNGLISNNSIVYIQNTTFKNMMPGCGVLANGGIISFTGLGGSYANSENTIENCQWGIKASNCDLTVNSVRTNGDVNTAVYYSNAGQVYINNCALGAKYYGIRGFNNPSSNVVIEKNSIHMSNNTVGVACIKLDEFGLDNVSVIDHNDMYLNKCRDGISTLGLNNSIIRDNYVQMNDILNRAGIWIANSQKNTIQCNTVNALGRYNSYQNGILINLSPENSFSCNWTHNQFEGIGVYGACSPLELKGNIFNDHAYGLSLKYNGLMGVQSNFGNQWNGIYTNYGAYLSGINTSSAQANQVLFYDPTSTNTLPTTNNDVLNFDWFKENGNADEFSCDSYDCQPFIPIGENDRIEDEIIAENDSIGTEYVEQSNYFADRFLFDRLTENPDLMNGNSILQAFYNQKLYGSIGQFNEMNQEISDAVRWETVYQIVYATNENMIRTCADSLSILDSLLAYGYNGPSNYEDLNKTIQNLYASNELLRETMTQIQNYRVENAIDENSQIPVSDQYEENEASVNNIYLETIATGKYELTPEQIITLQSIASQCPFSGGPSVYTARSIYSLADPEAGWDDDAICISNGILPRKAHFESSYTLFPNPTTGKVTLKYQMWEGESGMVSIYNTLGVLISSTLLENDSKEVEIDLSNLSPALYHYRVSLNNHQIKQGMISIIR